jgi:hypothetical protein
MELPRPLEIRLANPAGRLGKLLTLPEAGYHYVTQLAFR